MSSREGTKVASEEIDRVKNLIEECLMSYMNKNEVIHALQKQNIEPSFTEIILQNLEEQNQEFFKAYYLRVILKEQITRFNHLLEKQVAMMNELNKNEVVLPPVSHGSNIQPPSQPVPIDLQPSGQSINLGMHASSSNSPVLAQEPNVGMIHEMNNGIPITNDLDYNLDDLIPIDNAFVSSFNYMDPNQYQLHRTLSDDVSPYLLPCLDNLEGQHFFSGEKNTHLSTNLDFQIFGGDRFKEEP